VQEEQRREEKESSECVKEAGKRGQILAPRIDKLVRAGPEKMRSSEGMERGKIEKGFFLVGSERSSR